MLNRILNMLAFGETSILRWWFSFFSFGWGVLIFFAPDFGQDHRVMLAVAPAKAWCFLFLLHGASLMYGVCTRKFSFFLLIIEGVLGLALWGGAAISGLVSRGYPDEAGAGALIALFLLVRYPTHYTGLRCVDGR